MYYLYIILLVPVVIAAILAMVHIGFRAPRRIQHNNPADYGLANEETRIRTPGFCKSWILRYVEWVIGFCFEEIVYKGGTAMYKGGQTTFFQSDLAVLPGFLY